MTYVAPCLQLGKIYLDMLNIYKLLSERISNAISVGGKSQSYTYNIEQVENACIPSCWQ